MINPDFVERYQLLYKKDPSSKVFAPLVEAYRRMGLLDEAIEVGRKGVSFHPTFASGRIALARALMDKERWKEALDHLNEACELSPENLLAHNLLGEVYLKIREPKFALRAFKMALFLNAQDERARQQVERLESLTADEYEDDLFAPTRLEVVRTSQPPETPEFQREVQRIVSLTDAYLGRNDAPKAEELLQKALATFGRHPQLQKRWQLLEELRENAAARETEPAGVDLTEALGQRPEPLQPIMSTSGFSRSTETLRRQNQIMKLQALLQRINSHRLRS